MGLAIVAIPAEDDYVHKISSEKVAHLTLCYLGEPEGKPVQRIASFLEHAVSIMEIGPFGLDVDHRGTLGDDQADVLFFKKAWSGKRIEEFRAQLLKNNDIRDAYDSVPQYAEWTPHLTLGYPETPAKEDNRDYPGIHWVQFDRIALWTGESVGPEWRLEYNYNDDLAEVAMSEVAERGRDFLEHYGVKGMKWGQRRERGAAAVTTVTRTNRGVRANKTKVKAKGGHAQPATPDAIKAAVQKQKLKKSGPAALSNKELQELATRINLEKQVQQLTATKGKKVVARTLGNTGQQQLQRVSNEAGGKAVDAALSKRR
jgi:2'-5' RNA ligase